VALYACNFLHSRPVHHRAVHRARDEQAWWQAAGIDPIKIARKLWKDTRIDEGRVEPDHTPPAAVRRLNYTSWRRHCGASGAGLTISRHAHPDCACEELFHTASGTAFADLLVDGHRETWPIRSKRFRGWLRRPSHKTNVRA
jgi:hypothetical protein